MAMADTLNPYRKWLGIPLEDLPPHHYRLLGIEPFESDPDVIANAADGRMAQVKKFQSGQLSQWSQRLLNEIAAAKICLLAVDKKAAYDRQLRIRLADQSSAVPKAAPSRARQPEPTPDGQTIADVPHIEIASGSVRHAPRNGPRRRWPAWVWIDGAGLLLVVLAIWHSWGSGRRTPVAAPPPSAQATPAVVVARAAHAADRAATDSPAAHPGLSNNRPDEPAKGAAAEPGTGSRERTGHSVPRRGHRAGGCRRGAGRIAVDTFAGRPDRSGRTEHRTEPGRRATESRAAAGLPWSGTAAYSRPRSTNGGPRGRSGCSSGTVAAASTPEQKGVLAAKLLEHAKQTTDDVPTRFVLLRLAGQTFAQAGSLDEALGVVDRIEQQFEADATTEKASVLAAAIDALRDSPQRSSVSRQVASSARELAERAIAADDFEAANRFVKLATTAAPRRTTPRWPDNWPTMGGKSAA